MFPRRLPVRTRSAGIGVAIALLACQAAWPQQPLEVEAAALLEARCLNCHGAARMGGLDLRSRQTALAGGARGPSVTPGEASRSLLYQAVTGAGDLEMPMGGKPLTSAERDLLKRWIDAGAPWPTGGAGSGEPSWWAFRKPVRPALPKPSGGDQVQNPIDAFLAAKLEEQGLAPAPPASRHELVRRAYFDLHGLPPSPEEVDAFVNDPAPDAWERLIDRLLESARYGERQGRQWLDVVRYADTGGFETDIYFPNAWRYRDYVVKSFNDDKPYDVFLEEQIAGDEIWPDDLELRGGYRIPPEKERHLEARIGTGLYTFGPVYHEAALDGRQLRYEWMVDAVDMTGEAFLGLTVTCARCHDHKFDPLSRLDYHRLMALFAGAEIRQVPVVNKMSEFGFYTGYPRLLKAEEYKSAIRRLDQGIRDRILSSIKSRFAREVVEAFEVPSNQRTAAQDALAAPLEAAVTEARLKENASGKGLDLPYTPAEKDERERLLYELGKAALAANFQLATATVLGRADVLYPVQVTARGDWRATAETVEPGVPAILSEGFASPQAGPERQVLGYRRAFAEWLARPEHPLTARVMVNRIWQGHFGRGIVATPNNFGLQGEPPTHPELLDWLAVEFASNGWSVKKLHRLIMLSNAYRMSTRATPSTLAKDPENRWFSRMNRRRLDAETLRDATLAAAGSLNPRMGGKPVVPPLTEEERVGMWDASQWPESLDAAEHDRRSLYLYVKRSFPYPMFTTFDAPDTSVSCGRRDQTTVAPQALTMLNSAFTWKQAARLARRVRESGSSASQGWIDAVWKIAFARPPDAAESVRARELLEAAGEDSGLERLCLAVLNMNEFLYVD